MRRGALRVRRGGVPPPRSRPSHLSTGRTSWTVARPRPRRAAMIIENSTRIEAPPALVWRVTEDVERWPHWTPTVTSVERVDTGPLGLGSTARIRQPGQPISEWVVTVLEPERRFAWETRRPGLRMVGEHELFPDGDGTRNVLRVRATGPLSVLLAPLLRIAVPRALAAENAGLRSHCERVAGGGSP
jgi:uncharacterized protein YndB with AHSA1/START domain